MRVGASPARCTVRARSSAPRRGLLHSPVTRTPVSRWLGGGLRQGTAGAEGVRAAGLGPFSKSRSSPCVYHRGSQSTAEVLPPVSSAQPRRQVQGRGHRKSKCAVGRSGRSAHASLPGPAVPPPLRLSYLRGAIGLTPPPESPAAPHLVGPAGPARVPVPLRATPPSLSWDRAPQGRRALPSSWSA